MGESETTDKPQILVGIAFDDVFRAREFMSAANRLASRDDLTLRDAVLIVNDENGKINVVETVDPQPGRSAVSGAVWTGLLGLLIGGPVGWVAGTAVGAGTGVVAAKVIDLGISDEWVAWFRETSEPGTATVALLVSDLVEHALVEEAQRFTGAELVYANVSDDLLERLGEALGSQRNLGSASDGPREAPT